MTTDIADDQLRLHVLERVDALTEWLAAQRAELARKSYDTPGEARLAAVTTFLPAVQFVRELANAAMPGLDEHAERLASMAAAEYRIHRALDRDQQAELVIDASQLLSDIFIAGQLSGQIDPYQDWPAELHRLVLDALVASRTRQDREDGEDDLD